MRGTVSPVSVEVIPGSARLLFLLEMVARYTLSVRFEDGLRAYGAVVEGSFSRR